MPRESHWARPTLGMARIRFAGTRFACPYVGQIVGETMHHAERHVALRGVTASSWLVLGMLVSPMPAIAADAHKAVQVQHGEIVVLRNVSARPAYREAPPGMALIVNPSPRHELNGALDTGELSDDDYADLNVNASTGNRGAHGTTVERTIGSALGGSLGSRANASNDAGGTGFGHVVATPIGIGRVTSGIGNQMQGALSQLPGFAPSAPGGH
jgi:hypothetical protein